MPGQNALTPDEIALIKNMQIKQVLASVGSGDSKKKLEMFMAGPTFPPQFSVHKWDPVLEKYEVIFRDPILDLAITAYNEV